MMTEADLLLLCVWMEAQGEPADGQAAIVRVIQSRIKRKFFSDGTLRGTILAKDQFSWAYFAMLEDKYVRVAKNFTEAAQRAEVLWASVRRLRRLDPVREVVAQTISGTYKGGAEYGKLSDQVVNYCNLAISHPEWAKPEKLVCHIGHHSFYRK